MGNESITEVPVTSSEALIASAAELRSMIRAAASEAEVIGRYTPEVHEAFRNAGFYGLLTPRRYGGAEVDLSTFARVMMEVGRGDPGTAWCLSLGQGHALTAASFWSKEAQDDVFDNEYGYFRASHSLVVAGTAVPVEGGLLINARSPYQSGVAYASHATVSVVAVDGASGPADGGSSQADGGGHTDGPPRLLQVLIPARQFTMLDDWGAHSVFGMRASGSNSIVIEDQVVPVSYACELRLGPGGASGEVTTPGYVLHGNPMFLDVAKFGFFAMELVTPVVGAARAAMDEFEQLARTRSTLTPGAAIPRHTDALYQEDFGTARIKTDCAEAIVLHVAETIMRWGHQVADGQLLVTPTMDMGLCTMMMHAGEMACEVVELLFRSSGTSALGAGQPMQRYLRDVAMYRTHRAAQYGSAARVYGDALLNGEGRDDAAVR